MACDHIVLLLHEISQESWASLIWDWESESQRSSAGQRWGPRGPVSVKVLLSHKVWLRNRLPLFQGLIRVYCWRILTFWGQSVVLLITICGRWFDHDDGIVLLARVNLSNHLNMIVKVLHWKSSGFLSLTPQLVFNLDRYWGASSVHIFYLDLWLTLDII